MLIILLTDCANGATFCPCSSDDADEPAARKSKSGSGKKEKKDKAASGSDKEKKDKKDGKCVLL